MKYTILGILFVAILLFGCVQQEVETPDLEEEQVIPVNGDEVPEETVDEIEETDETESEDGTETEEEVQDGFLSQVCTYSDAESESTYYLTEDKMKMVTIAQGMSLEFIIDLNDNIMYDKGGMMLMGMSDLSGCDWVIYDFNEIQEVLEDEGLVSEEEDMMGDMTEMDDSFVCENMSVSEDEFVVTGEVCDGTEEFINLLLMMQQYQ
jgi:hypothetical protein